MGNCLFEFNTSNLELFFNKIFTAYKFLLNQAQCKGVFRVIVFWMFQLQLNYINKFKILVC